jgi:hypothetical protein
VCLYIQVIILCCNGSISAVALLNFHELYGFFVTLFNTMLHVMVLTGFWDFHSFCKKIQSRDIFTACLSLLLIQLWLIGNVVWCLYSRFYYIAEDQSQPCWSKIWWIMDCYHDLVLYRVILRQCWQVCTALWILTVLSLRQHDLSSHQFINWVSSDLIQQIFNPCACAVSSKLAIAMEKDSLQGCLGFPWLAASKKYVLMHAVTWISKLF